MSNPSGDKTNGSVQAQVETYLVQLDALMRRGRELCDLLARDGSSVPAVAATRAWQEHCGVTINQLSGGSKAHWLARAFSEAFLMRAASGDAAEEAPTEKIVERLLTVLQRAKESLTRTDNPPMATTTLEPTPRRFDFVHNTELRPVLEQAYTESRQALEDGDYDSAMRTSCGVLEAIVTDALEHKNLPSLAAVGAPQGKINDRPFTTRLELAEKTGMIRGGWVRLTEAARRYREEGASETPVTEIDARRAVQVLNVIMRDLNPGR